MKKNSMLSWEMEKEFEWRKWSKEIPFIKFPNNWEVKVVPPFAGAIVRFVVNTEDRRGISVYLDCYDMLGFFGEPHWEVYPDKDENNQRFKMNDIKGLLNCISGK